MSADFDRQGLIGFFVAEAEDSLARIWNALHPPDDAVPGPESVREEYIAAHTLKGASALYGYAEVAGLTNYLESLVERSVEVPADRWPETVGMLRDLTFTLRTQIQAIKERGMEDAGASEAWARRFVHLLPSDGSFPRTADSMEEHTERPTALPGADLSDSYLLPEIDAEVVSYFAPEAQEYIEAIEGAILRLEKSPDDAELLQQLFRTAHTLKGSAHTVGFKSIGDLIHHVEDFVGALRDGRIKITAELTDTVFRVVDVVKMLMKRDPRMLEQVRREFLGIMARLAQIGLPAAKPAGARGASIPRQSPVGGEDQTVEPSPDSDQRKDGEARGEETAVIRVSRDRLERLLNLVGELVISRGRLEQRLVSLEQLSNQLLAFKGRMLDAVRTFEEKHTFTLPTPTSAQSTMTAQGRPNLAEIQKLGEFGVLEFDRYDDFNILARRLAEVSADVSESMAQLNGSIRKAREDMGQLQQLSLSMRDEIARARMVPIGTPFVRFHRAVREMARHTEKQVVLVTAGEQTEVDTGVVERLVDPLIHLVRNAVYHGIEPATVRVARGKPATGTVYLTASHRGNAVVIEVEDDGGGIDVAKIKSKAISLGMLAPESAASMSDSDAIKLIFLPGFSTAEHVGEVAGRGVGMDVVKQTLEAMNGQIEVETELGMGTKFTLRLPLTLLISTALLVRAGSERYALPLPNIREVVMPLPGSIQEIGGRPVLHLSDEAIDVQLLTHLLGIHGDRAIGATPVVIIRTATGVQGLVVDELLGRQEIVIKALSELKPFQESPFVGATIDPEGQVILVLDVARLFAGHRVEALLHAPQNDSARTGRDLDGEGRPSSIAPTAVKILLIDDSLSIRKFVGKMVEAAGYEIDTAVDGEEGLRKAATGDYRLIITDLEMPKLNGYEVIQGLRDRPQTKTTPVLVMTTRAGEKHRQMALSVGASGYIAKPVEERTLIAEITRWLGQPAGVKS